MNIFILWNRHSDGPALAYTSKEAAIKQHRDSSREIQCPICMFEKQLDSCQCSWEWKPVDGDFHCSDEYWYMRELTLEE